MEATTLTSTAPAAVGRAMPTSIYPAAVLKGVANRQYVTAACRVRGNPGCEHRLLSLQDGGLFYYTLLLSPPAPVLSSRQRGRFLLPIHKEREYGSDNQRGYADRTGGAADRFGRDRRRRPVVP